MTTIMTPSKTTTDGQITKAVSNYRALLEKHAPEFPSEAVQVALEQPGFASKMFAIFRECVEAVSNMITRCAPVNRNLTPQEALDATGRKQYTDSQVVANMPRGKGDQPKTIFFKLDLSQRGGYISDDDLEKEFELRGLVPEDPDSLAAVNEADPAFADEHPNGTHWKDADEKWCFATFRRWLGERNVLVDRDGDDWCDDWWFAGRCK
jgi:hypothetical protein